MGPLFLGRLSSLTAQRDRILAAGPLYSVTLDDLSMGRGLDIGDFYQVVSGVHHRLSNFIHWVVVHRRDEVAELDSGGPIQASIQVAPA